MPLPINIHNLANRGQQDVMPQAMHSVNIDLSCTLPHGELTRLYRTIETALPDEQRRIVQFVSAYQGEGVNTIAFETAVIAARMIGKRVLFIDTSAALPGVPGKLPESVGIPLDTLLLTGQPPNEAIARVSGTDLYFAMLREREQDGMAPVSLNAIEGALQYLRNGFDLIILDSPAVLSDAFGMALAKLADGSILVVEAERTRSPVALESKRMIESAGGKVIGCVLNRRRFYIPKLLYRLLYRHDPL